MGLSILFDRGDEMFMGAASKMVRCSEMVCSEEIGDWGCYWINLFSSMILGWLVDIVDCWMGGVY